MSSAYVVGDMLSLTMAMFRYPEAWVGVSTPGRNAPARAAAKPFCPACVQSSSVANAKIKQQLREDRTQIYLFPTYDDLCGVRFDIATPHCTQCGGPKNEVDKR